MEIPGKLIGIIADEDTVVGFLLGGIGEMTKISKEGKEPNYLIVNYLTPVSEIHHCFERFIKRTDMDIILISQSCADKIRHLIQSKTTVLPAVIEIPTKDCPYDPKKDSLLNRVRGLYVAPDESFEESL